MKRKKKRLAETPPAEPSSRPGFRWPHGLLVFFGAVLGMAGLWWLPALFPPRPAPPEIPPASDTSPPAAVPPAEPEAPSEFAITDPAVAAQGYCQTCHLFPEPHLLDRKSWLEGALVLMAIRLGVAQMPFDQRPDGQIIKEAQIFPTAPILPEDHWRLIIQHYARNAPEQPLPPPPRPPIRIGLPLFRVRTLPASAAPPRICLIQIDEANRQLFTADAATHALDIWNPEGKRLRHYPLSNDPVQLIAREDGYYLTMIGELLPSDFLHGSVGVLRTSQNRYVPFLENLRRPTGSAFADLNQDGLEDIVVCQFGNILGRLSWFKNLGNHQYEEFVLFDWPGSTFVFVRDMNGDGRPDILAMIGQAREGIYLWINQGNDEFEQTVPLQFPPVWGYSHFELVDFNADGFPDILATNGDNGDYFSRPKAYHGIRLYLNDGENQFQEAWFYPLNGAYEALPADFDGDGDLDIAAIAFFSDYEHSPEESFVYLENKGGLQFEASGFAESTSSRWLTMDAGDLDGDGDVDLALGAFFPGPARIRIPPALYASWETNQVPVLILENTRH